MLICDETEETNFPRTRGAIIVNQNLTGICPNTGTFQSHKNGVKYTHIDNRHVIDRVIGYGKSLSINFPTTPLPELNVYHSKHNKTIFTGSDVAILAGCTQKLTLDPGTTNFVFQADVSFLCFSAILASLFATNSFYPCAYM